MSCNSGLLWLSKLGEGCGQRDGGSIYLEIGRQEQTMCLRQ